MGCSNGLRWGQRGPFSTRCQPSCRRVPLFWPKGLVLGQGFEARNHGLSASQSGGVVLPASWSATSPRLIFSNFSALPLSSACAINPQAWGQCKVSLSTVFSYCGKAVRDTVLREIAATLKTLQQANHCRKFWGPGSSFIKNWPFPSGANVRNF